MSRIGYIYKYSFPNGKVYIGQTRTSVEQRHYTHMSDARRETRGCLVDVALAKYGEIKPEIIETIETKDEEATKFQELLNDAEKKWIKFYDSTDKSKGYNIQQGGTLSTPEKMILEEKWYEIFQKEGWGEMLGWLHQNLESIGQKLYVSHEKLTKDERKAWYWYKFRPHLDLYRRLHTKTQETTFCDYFKQWKRISDGDDLIDFQDAILHNAWDELIFDVQQTIWDQIMKNKDKIIKEYWSNAKIKRI